MPYAFSVMYEHVVTEAMTGMSQYSLGESGDEGCRQNHSRLGSAQPLLIRKQGGSGQASQLTGILQYLHGSIRPLVSHHAEALMASASSCPIMCSIKSVHTAS